MAGAFQFYKDFNTITPHPERLASDPSVEIIFSETLEKGIDFQNALEGLNNIPLPPAFRAEVEKDLRLPVHRSLYRLQKPTILVFTWPNGETRHFVFTQNGILLEKNDFWLKYFPFIKREENFFRLSGVVSESGLIQTNNSFVWCPDMANFTHFLVDAFSPYISLFTNLGASNKFAIPQFSRMPSWQNEFFHNLGERKLFQGAVGSFLLFEPNELFFPVISGTLERLIHVSAYFKSISVSKASQSGKIRPIFLTRHDERSARIRNSEEIARYVMKKGGLCIDPSKLGIRKKRELFSMDAIFLCEGSGNTNVSVFGSNNSRVICLLDATAIADPAFIQGGWPYFHATSNRTDFICGTDCMKLIGSPLNSCNYNLRNIEEIIQRYC